MVPGDPGGSAGPPGGRLPRPHQPHPLRLLPGAPACPPPCSRETMQPTLLRGLFWDAPDAGCLARRDQPLLFSCSQCACMLTPLFMHKCQGCIDEQFHMCSAQRDR